jgi:hypothetical protein
VDFDIGWPAALQSPAITVSGRMGGHEQFGSNADKHRKPAVAMFAA